MTGHRDRDGASSSQQQRKQPKTEWLMAMMSRSIVMHLGPQAFRHTFVTGNTADLSEPGVTGRHRRRRVPRWVLIMSLG
eukprot:3318565-Rhodomonas_salina.1